MVNRRENEQTELLLLGNEKYPLSIKDYQNIYHHITKRTEKIEKNFSDNFKFTIEDLVQLNIKLFQTLDQYNKIAYNTTVVVVYVKDQKEEFSSFERFLMYNSSSTSPTLEVVLEYQFSLLPPQTAQRLDPQNYKVTIKLSSRLGIQEKLNEDERIPDFIQIGLISLSTATVIVEYADYVIARNFIECFCEWTKGCDQDKTPKIISFFKEISSTLSLLTKYSVIVFVLYAIYVFAENNIYPELPMRTILQQIIIFFGVFIIFSDIGMRLGRSVEFFIDSYSPVSYLRLNKGDEKIINQEKSNFRRKVINLCVKFASAIILGVITKVISAKLF